MTKFKANLNKIFFPIPTKVGSRVGFGINK